MQNKLPLNSVNDTPDADVPTLNIVIAYDDVPAGQRAMHTLADLGRDFADEMDLGPQLWRFEYLEDPDWRALATVDALKADMLIISTTSKTELPAAVESWLTACLAQKHGTSAAIVALLGTVDNMDEPDSPRFQFLRRVAIEAGLDFFAPRPRKQDSLDSTLNSIHRRADTVTRTLDEILHQPTPRWQGHS
jgi:hypothetical protein